MITEQRRRSTSTKKRKMPAPKLAPTWARNPGRRRGPGLLLTLTATQRLAVNATRRRRKRAKRTRPLLMQMATQRLATNIRRRTKRSTLNPILRPALT
jgi:hypothetical protein